MLTTSDLQGKRVRRESGEALGRVFEIHARDGRVEALVCGVGGMLQRLSNDRSGRRVAWDTVVRVTPTEIVVRDAAR